MNEVKRVKENVVKNKSFLFAVRIIELYKYLTKLKKEYVISKQLLRSGTSIGALVREAEHAESNKDFIHKLSIAQKEANETLYWLELLKETSFITGIEFQSIFNEAYELKRIITSIIVTMKSK